RSFYDGTGRGHRGILSAGVSLECTRTLGRSASGDSVRLVGNTFAPVVREHLSRAAPPDSERSPAPAHGSLPWALHRNCISRSAIRRIACHKSRTITPIIPGKTPLVRAVWARSWMITRWMASSRARALSDVLRFSGISGRAPVPQTRRGVPEGARPGDPSEFV